MVKPTCSTACSFVWTFSVPDNSWNIRQAHLIFHKKGTATLTNEYRKAPVSFVSQEISLIAKPACPPVFPDYAIPAIFDIRESISMP